MFTRCFATTIAAVALLAGSLGADSETPNDQRPGLPDLPSATIQVGWTDVKGLVEQAQLPVPKEEGPPVPWTLGGAFYDVTVVSDTTAKISSRFDITVFQPKGWVQIPIVGDVVAPVSVILDGTETALVRGANKQLSLLLNEPGRHVLECVFFASCAPYEGSVTLSFPCTPTPVARMRLDAPFPNATVRAPAAASIAVEKTDAGVTAELAFRSTEIIEVSWTQPALVAEKKPEETRAECQVATLAAAGERHVACRSSLMYTVLRGKADTFRFSLPSGVNILAVEGEGAAWTHTVEEAGQLVEVKVNHQIEDRYELQVRYEKPIDEQQTAVAIPALVTRDVVRTTGYIGVTAQGALELAPGPDIAALVRVDVSELPPTVRAMSANPILLAYKYTDGAYALSLDVHKLEDVPVRVASIDRAELTTVVTEDGMAVNKATYFVRNEVKQFLRVDLGEGVEVWGAEVGGRPVKPAKEPDSNTVLIPLFKSVETNRRLDAFPVAIVYMERIPELGGLSQTLAFRTPATDILANEMEWTVLLPEGRRVYRSSGDLKPEEARGGRAGSPESLLRQVISAQDEQVYRLGEGIERFFITDLNNPAAALARGPRRYRGDPIESAEDKQAAVGEVQDAIRSADIAVAGVLPVRIALPVEGVPHRFRRVLAPQGEISVLRLYTFDARLRGVAAAGLILLGAVAGALLARRFKLQWPGSRSGLVVSAAVWVTLVIASVGLAANWRIIGITCLAFLIGGAAVVAVNRRIRPADQETAEPDAPFSSGAGNGEGVQ